MDKLRHNGVSIKLVTAKPIHAATYVHVSRNSACTGTHAGDVPTVHVFCGRGVRRSAKAHKDPEKQYIRKRGTF